MNPVRLPLRELIQLSLRGKKLIGTQVNKVNAKPIADLAIAPQVTSREQNHLKTLLEESRAIVYKAQTVFPLDLFPDIVSIDENKVNIVRHSLLAEQVHSVLVEDISEVTVQTIWFLGTLQLTDSSNPRFPLIILVGPMWAKEALKTRRIIQGIVKAKREKVDLASCEKGTISKFLEKLGEAWEQE